MRVWPVYNSTGGSVFTLQSRRRNFCHRYYNNKKIGTAVARRLVSSRIAPGFFSFHLLPKEIRLGEKRDSSKDIFFLRHCDDTPFIIKVAVEIIEQQSAQVLSF
jgi:hypothetical protein